MVADSDHPKPLEWRGTSRVDLHNDKVFSAAVRKVIGYELFKVQIGQEPTNWKPFDVVGAGTKELRVRLADGAYRVLYVVKFPDAVYVLHCFKKKSDKTLTSDKELASERYKELINERKNHEN